jgi:hypothetical protein
MFKSLKRIADHCEKQTRIQETMMNFHASADWRAGEYLRIQIENSESQARIEQASVRFFDENLRTIRDLILRGQANDVVKYIDGMLEPSTTEYFFIKGNIGYFAGTDDTGFKMITWEQDPYKAYRFSKREDAEFISKALTFETEVLSLNLRTI